MFGSLTQPFAVHSLRANVEQKYLSTPDFRVWECVLFSSRAEIYHFV